MPAPQSYRVGLIVPSSNVTMETEIPALLRAYEAAGGPSFTFHQGRRLLARLAHRDIKPSNLLLTSSGKLVLIDFGIACQCNATTEHRLVGRPSYCSPEQILGRPADGRSDVYSLGCTLYELVFGRPPFGADDVDGTIEGHLRGTPKFEGGAARRYGCTVLTLVEAVYVANTNQPSRRERRAHQPAATCMNCCCCCRPALSVQVRSVSLCPFPKSPMLCLRIDLCAGATSGAKGGWRRFLKRTGTDLMDPNGYDGTILESLRLTLLVIQVRLLLFFAEIQWRVS